MITSNDLLRDQLRLVLSQFTDTAGIYVYAVADVTINLEGFYVLIDEADKTL